MSHSVLCYSSPKELRQYLILKTLPPPKKKHFNPINMLILLSSTGLVYLELVRIIAPIGVYNYFVCCISLFYSI